MSTRLYFHQYSSEYFIYLKSRTRDEPCACAMCIVLQSIRGPWCCSVYSFNKEKNTAETMDTKDAQKIFTISTKYDEQCATMVMLQLHNMHVALCGRIRHALEIRLAMSGPTVLKVRFTSLTLSGSSESNNYGSYVCCGSAAQHGCVEQHPL